MSAFEAVLARPELGYALVAELLPVIAAENHHIKAELRDSLALAAALMQCCQQMPTCMGALLLFWLAKAHTGVRRLFVECEPDQARAAAVGRIFDASARLIDELAKLDITEDTAPARAAAFFVGLSLFADPQCGEHWVALALADVPQKVTYENKMRLTSAWHPAGGLRPPAPPCSAEGAVAKQVVIKKEPL